MRNTLSILAALIVAAGSLQAQEITEGTHRKTADLGHKPGSWLSMTSAPQVSGIFTYDQAKNRFVIDERVNAPDYKIESLPSMVKLDLARARERRAREGSTRTYANLREELEDSLDHSNYELYNRYVPSERRDLWKTIHGTDDFGWWGNCNGSAAAAVMEKLPEGDVEVNGVKFTPSDFQHYYTLAYNTSGSVDWAGSRSDLPSSAVSKMKDALKKKGTPTYLDDLRAAYKEAHKTDAPSSWEAMHFEETFANDISAYDDMTPPDFHRFLTEHIDRGEAFIFDRSAGHVVWNYPASGYEFEITKGEQKNHNGELVRVYHVKAKVAYGDYHDFTWEGGSGYTYDLYVSERNGQVVGGEWTGSSVDDHPDFAWRPRKRIADSGILNRLPQQERSLTARRTSSSAGCATRATPTSRTPCAARTTSTSGSSCATAAAATSRPWSTGSPTWPAPCISSGYTRTPSTSRTAPPPRRPRRRASSSGSIGSCPKAGGTNAVKITVIVVLAAVAAMQPKDERTLETLGWDEAGRLFQKHDKAQYAAEARPAEMKIEWKAGDRWTAEVFTRKLEEKRGGSPWRETSETYEYEVKSCDADVNEERFTIEVRKAGEIAATVTVTSRADGLQATSAEAVPFDLPGRAAKGREYASPLGIPVHAKIFSEGAVSFPSTDVPKSSGKAIDVEFKRKSGARAFQRWDPAVPVFPLCSFTLDRAVLLRSWSRAK